MQTYGSLDLKKLRDDNGLDFAHFTYKPGMCSCCYGPLDLPALYWAGRKKPDQNYKFVEDGVERPAQYILFKNADNGDGYVTRDDIICMPPKHLRRYVSPFGYSNVCIEWDFPEEKMDGVLRSLREQLDEDYEVLRPDSPMQCIQIVLRDRVTEKEKPYIFKI